MRGASLEPARSPNRSTRGWVRVLGPARRNKAAIRNETTTAAAAPARIVVVEVAPGDQLTGVLIVLSAPLCGFSLRDSWRTMVRDGRNHSSPNSGVPEAATAGALGVQLGGTNSYFGRPVDKPTIGDPVKPLDRDAWRGAVRLMYGAEGLLLAGWFCSIVVWQYWR